MQPNILLLQTDQQRFDTIAALGHSHMITPNIDRLVNIGTSFTKAYSSNPLCKPARHDLLTGASPAYHGYFENNNKPIKYKSLKTLPSMMTAVGYKTYAVGKMHFVPEDEHHGFNKLYLME